MTAVVDEVRTRIAVVALGEDGIIRQTVVPGADETLGDAQDNVRAARLLARGRRLPTLVDMRAIRSQAREARVYYGGQEATQTSCAVALLVESRVSMLIANFFLTVTAAGSKRPARVFTDEAEALAWLRGTAG